MKKIMASLLIATLCCPLMAACVTKSNPAQTEVTYPGVGTVNHHCPPGHRKKGECY